MADMFKHSEICGADLDSLDVEDLTIINEYYNEKICLREEDKVKLTIGKKKMVVRAINDELEVEKREAAFKKFREPVKEVELQVEVKNVWDVSVALQTFKGGGGAKDGRSEATTVYYYRTITNNLPLVASLIAVRAPGNGSMVYREDRLPRDGGAQPRGCQLGACQLPKD